MARYVLVDEGPYGGIGGAIAGHWCMPADALITGVEVKWGRYINQLALHCASASTGPLVIAVSGQWPSRFPYYDFIPLPPGTSVQAISGRSGEYVDSLSILTSAGTYGPYGGSGGSTPFEYPVPSNGQLAGLFGRAGYWMDALGVVWRIDLDASVKLRPRPADLTRELK